MPKCLSIPTVNILLTNTYHSLCVTMVRRCASEWRSCQRICLCNAFHKASAFSLIPNHLSHFSLSISIPLYRQQIEMFRPPLQRDWIRKARMKQGINSARYNSPQGQQRCQRNDLAFLKLLPLWKQPIIFLVVLWNASISDRTSEWEIIWFIFDCFCSIDTLLYTLSPIVSSTASLIPSSHPLFWSHGVRVMTPPTVHIFKSCR